MCLRLFYSVGGRQGGRRERWEIYRYRVVVVIIPSRSAKIEQLVI